MINFLDALETVLGFATPVDEQERVPLIQALGRHLAQDMSAREDIPIADNSAMDGYAVRAEDLISTARQDKPLKVVEVLAAEQTTSTTLGAGQAMKIMTGATIPPGADSVVMVERTRTENGQVWVDDAAFANGQHVRPAGGDLKAGEVVLKSGHRLNAAHLGQLASMGYGEVPVYRKLRVGILATGNELVPPEGELTVGKVRNANSYSLFGLTLAVGAHPQFLGIAPDEPTALKRTLTEAIEQHDVLVTSGGVSMGDFDYVKSLVGELDLSIHFKELNIKPGKPVIFGNRGPKLFFGLPGNPVSTMVTFTELVRPALLKMQRDAHVAPRSIWANMEEGFAKKDGKRHFLRGILHEREGGLPGVRLTGGQASNILRSMGRANCLVVMEESREQYTPGDLALCHLFEGAPFER